MSVYWIHQKDAFMLLFTIELSKLSEVQEQTGGMFMPMNNEYDQNTNPIDFTELLADHEGEWVVISEDKKRILAFSESLKDIMENVEDGFVMRVPRFDGAYADSILRLQFRTE